MSVLIYSNPGNASLWALLSRVIPQYYPRKANVSPYAYLKERPSQYVYFLTSFLL